MTLSLFFQLLVNGLALGLLYVLVVLGLDVIMRVTRIVNFAHGQIYMLGAYAFFYTNMVFRMNFAIGLILAGIAMAVLGGICYILVFYQMQRHFKTGEGFVFQMIMSAMASLGLMMIFSQGAIIIFGSQTRNLKPLFPQLLSIGNISVPADKVVIIVISLLVLIGLYFLMFKTKLGKAMRAVSLDAKVSSLYGINAFRIYLLGFSIGCGLAGIAGGIIAPVFAITTDMGNSIIFTALMVMIMGGIGSYKGTIIGGIAVGLLSSFGIFFIGGLVQLLLVTVVIVLLIFRPGGLFGEILD